MHRKFKKVYLVVLILFSESTFFYPQSPKIEFERILDGKYPFYGSVSCIIQDKRGLIWFGDEDGLYRYDGYELKPYTHQPFNFNSINDNWVTSLCEDESSNIWIGTMRGGLSKLEVSKSRFTNYNQNSNSQNSISDNQVQTIVNTENYLWIGTINGGLNRFDKQKKQFKIYKHNPADTTSISSNNILALYIDSNTNLWIGTFGGGLNRMDIDKEKFYHYKHNPDMHNSISFNIVSTIFEDQSGDLWIGTGNWYAGIGGGLNRFNKKTSSFEHFKFNPLDQSSLKSNIITSLCQFKSDNQKYLWIATYGGGLNCYDFKSNKFYSYTNDPRDPQSLSSDEIISIFEDNKENIWVGTKGQGLHKASLKEKKIKHFKINPHDRNSLNHPIVMAIFEDHKYNLWIGTYGGGLNYYNKKSDKYYHFKNNPNNANSISNNFIFSIIEDYSGNLWIGTDNGLNTYNPENKSYKSYLNDTNIPNSISDNRVICLYLDKDSILWIGTRLGGLNRLDLRSMTFKHFKNNPNNLNSLSNNIVMNIIEDREGHLWIGTFNGLNRFDKGRETFVRYVHDVDNKDGISCNSIECSYEDNSGNIWVATAGGGLCKFIKNTNKFVHFTTKDGLPSDIIYGIESNNGIELWLSTNNGICVFNTITQDIITFDESDGLQAKEFIHFSHFNNNKGEIYFGGINGLNSFFVDSLVAFTTPPSIIITDFKVNDEVVDIERAKKSYSLYDSNEIAEVILPYDQNFFSIKFTAIDFTNPSKNEYAYRLVGLDEDWIYCGYRRETQYTNLSPGEYVFCVKGSNNHGIWNEKGTALSIIITPPWWATWWFRTIILLTIIGIGYTIYGYRINKIREVERLRIQIASDLHDDIGSALTRIAVHSEIIGTTSEKSKVIKSSKQIGTMSREIITTLSDVVWSIDSRNDTIGDLIDRMRDFLDTVFPAGSIHIDFQTKGLHFEQKLEQALRQNIYLIFKEAVNNAARHSGADEIKISLINGSGKFKMEISDNGKGMDEEEKHKGHHGIENMKLRAERISGELSICHLEKGMSVELIAKSI